MKSMNESKHGFWGVLARKAKAILDEDTEPQHFETPERKRSPMSAATPTMGKVSFSVLYLYVPKKKKKKNLEGKWSKMVKIF